MNRVALAVIVVLGFAVLGPRVSRAAYVLTLTPTPCPGTCTPTPNPTVTPTPAPPVVATETPVKFVTIGNPTPGPVGTTEYLIDVTSQFVCFALAETVQVSVFAPFGVAVLRPLDPSQSSAGTTVNVQVDPTTGHALLSLEVLNMGVGAEGVHLTAYWPAEDYQSTVTVIPGAGETVTATPTPTETPTPTLTPTPTETPGPGTPRPTATPTQEEDTPTPTPVPIAPHSALRAKKRLTERTLAEPASSGAPPVAACVQPSIAQGSTVTANGTLMTLYGLTAPGAICTAGATDYAVSNLAAGIGGVVSSSASQNFDGSSQTASSAGLTKFLWDEVSAGDFGIATVTCSLDNGPPATACAAFVIEQTKTSNYIGGLSTQQLVSLLSRIERRYCPVGSQYLAPLTP